MLNYWVEGRFDGGGRPPVTMIYIYDQLGRANAGTSAADLARDLRNARGHRVEVRIDCSGGTADDAFEMFDALRAHPGGVTTSVDGAAASGGSIVAMAGSLRTIDRNGSIMVHWPHCTRKAANRDERQFIADLTAEYAEKVAGIYADVTNTAPGVWLDRMKAETWFSADEAVRVGLVDQVVGSVAWPEAIARRGGPSVRPPSGPTWTPEHSAAFAEVFASAAGASPPRSRTVVFAAGGGGKALTAEAADRWLGVSR